MWNPLKDDSVIETEIISVLEYWLSKIEEEAAKIFRQKSESRTETRWGTKPGIGDLSAMNQEFETSDGESFEHAEDRRTPSFIQVSPRLCSSINLDFLEDRTRIQFIRWSNTRVYNASNDEKKDPVQETLDKVRKSVSRVMYQADADDILLSGGPSSSSLAE